MTKKVFFGCFFVIFFIFSFVFANNEFADLKISEVYYHQTKEWIEIINIGTGSFSGELQIKSDATNTGIVSDFFLKSGGIAILGQTDSTKYFLSQYCVFDSGLLNFDVNDNGDSIVSIYYSGNLLDSVVLSGNYKKYKSSLFRSGDNMFSTTETGIYNTYHRYYMNPCSSKLLGQNNFTDWYSFLSNNSGLIISEVFFDGSREWIEVTNTSLNDFNGKLSFVGIGNDVVVYDTTIPAQSVKVFKQSGVSYITGNIDYQDESLFNKFRDDERLSISMFLGENQNTGNILDLFSVSRTDIGILDDQKKSFEKILSGSKFIIVYGDVSRQYNTNDLSYIVNPGVVYDNLGNIIYPIQPIIVPQTGLIKFSEINKTDGYVSNYIEFYIQTGVSGIVTLSGNSIGGQKFWTGNFNTGGYYLFLGQSLPINDKIKNLSTLSISDGDLELYYNGILQDKITISNIDLLQTGQVLYRNGNNFNIIGTGTPGLSEDFVSLLPRQEKIITNIVYITGDTVYVNNGGGGGGSSCPVCPTQEELCGTGIDIINNTGNIVQSGQNNLGNKILSISYLLINPDGNDYGKEEIGIVLNTGNFLNISGYELKYSDGKHYIFGKDTILQKGCENVFTGIASLVNSKDICIDLYSGNMLLDNVCYEKNTKRKVFLTGFNTCVHGFYDYNGTGFQNSTGSTVGTGLIGGSGQNGQGSGQSVGNYENNYLFKIIDIVYDPPGSDAGNEEITIRNLYNNSNNNNSGNINMSQFFLLVKGKKKTLQGFIQSGGTQTFKKTFGFLNSTGMCIELRDSKTLYDTYCYDPNNKDLGDEDNNVQTGQVIDYRQFDVSITNVVYDPKKQGGQSESITLLLNIGDKVDVSKLRVKVNNNRSYKTIGNGFLEKGKKKTFLKKFLFPNIKDSIIHLYYKSGSQYFEYDSFSYFIPKENIQETGKDESWKKREIRIRNIVYDPPGNDAGNEQVDIELTNGETIDLQYYRLEVNGKNKRIYGLLYPNSIKKLKGTFGLSNSKETCVRLKRDVFVFDTMCYDPNENKMLTGTDDLTGIIIGTGNNISGKIEKILLKKIDYSKINLQILGIDYDPIGNDKGNESIKLKYYGGNYTLNLSDGFFLKIGNKKRSLKYFGKIDLGEEKVLKGTFGFPNKMSTCVELWNKNGNIFLSKYCYTPFQKVNNKKNKKKNIKKRVFSKIDEQNKLLKVYIKLLEDELKNNWTDLRYNSKLSRYAKLYNDAKRLLKKGKKYIFYHGVKIDIYDLTSQYQILFGRDDATRISDFVRLITIGQKGEEILWK